MTKDTTNESCDVISGSTQPAWNLVYSLSQVQAEKLPTKFGSSSSSKTLYVFIFNISLYIQVRRAYRYKKSKPIAEEVEVRWKKRNILLSFKKLSHILCNSAK